MAITFASDARSLASAVGSVAAPRSPNSPVSDSESSPAEHAAANSRTSSPVTAMRKVARLFISSLLLVGDPSTGSAPEGVSHMTL